MALAEFRALGERFGISFALTELADRIAVRGELAAACEHYEQAIAVLTETGAVEDVIQIRSRQAQLYWLLGDEDSSAAAIAEAQRYAERVTWPDALAELAFSQAELARWNGDAEEARRQLGLAATMLGDAAEQPNIRAVTHDLLGYLADDLVQARAHHAAACQAAAGAGYAPLIATGARRGRGPGAAPRPGRAGRAAARGERRRARDCRIGRVRTRPGSSGQRGAASATRGSPRRLGREHGSAGLSWRRSHSLPEGGNRPHVPDDADPGAPGEGGDHVAG